MSEPRLDLNFYIGGIEDAMIARLKQACPYAREVEPYSGELDADNLREALVELSPRFPLFLVSYVEGKNIDRGGLGPEIGTPRERKHQCTFTVIAADDDARGPKARRRGAPGSPGVFQMNADADTALSGMQFSATFEAQNYLLNPEPLNLADVEVIAHLPELTAYALHFETWFIYFTPDRREPGQQVEEIQVDIYPPGGGAGTQLPGVTLK